MKNSMDDLEKYLDQIESSQALLASNNGAPIKILFDREQILEAQEETATRLTKAGMPAEWANVGIVFEDQYLLILRDAVQFPSGKAGTYLRIVEKPVDHNGVVVFPVQGDRLLLIKHFRHPTRRWHWEVPRGFADAGETEVESMLRELKEEVSATPTKHEKLGEAFSNTGMASRSAAVYYAEIEGVGSLEKEEGINDFKLVDHEELDSLLKSGEVNDSYTLAAISLAKAHGVFG